MLADDFYVMLPFIGPLPKDTFLRIFGSFAIKDAFADFKENYFGYTVDPAQPNRVWVMSRGIGTHTGAFVGIEPTNKRVELPPTVSSVSFNEEGLATKFTTGYGVDREEGNSGGLSAAFGLIYAVDPNKLPFPEAQPYKPSFAIRFLQAVGGLQKILFGNK